MKEKITTSTKRALQFSYKETSSFLDGFTAPLHALNFLRWHVALLRYTIFPVLINIIIFAFGLWFIISRVTQWTGDFIPDTNGWWKALLIIINIIIIAMIVGAALLMFAGTARIIAAPFNEQLSKATEEILTKTKEQEEKLTLKLITEDAWRTIKEEIIKLAFFVVVEGLLLPLNLIPAAGSILYAIVATPITWLFASFDTIDIPLARRKIPMKQRRKFMTQHKALFLGYGLATSLLIAIPILNLLFMPVIIIAGTMLFIQRQHTLPYAKEHKSAK